MFSQLPRLAEVHLHACGLGELLVPGPLFALIVGERLAHGLGHLVELGREGGQGTLCSGIGHATQQHQACAAFDQHTHGRAVVGALDKVALPMPRHKPVIDLRWAHMNAEHLGNLASPILPRRAWPAATAPLAQQGKQLLRSHRSK